MRRPLIAVLLLAACNSSSSEQNAVDASVDAAPDPLDPTVRFVVRTDLAPGREFDSVQVELGTPGTISRTNDCASERGEVIRMAVSEDTTTDFAAPVVLATKKPEELPLEARVLLCLGGMPKGAFYRQVAVAGEDAGTGNVTYVSFVDAGTGILAPEENAIDIVFDIARDFAATCAGAPPPACVERMCDSAPVFLVPRDAKCDDGQICDLAAGCVARD